MTELMIHVFFLILVTFIYLFIAFSLPLLLLLLVVGVDAGVHCNLPHPPADVPVFVARVDVRQYLHERVVQQVLGIFCAPGVPDAHGHQHR